MALAPSVRELTPTIVLNRDDEGNCIIYEFDAPKDADGVYGEVIRYSYKLAGEGAQAGFWTRVWNREYCQG